MSLLRVSLLLVALGAWDDPALAQSRQTCLHSSDETAVQGMRRQEAQAATELIVRVLDPLPNSTAVYPTWEELATSTAVDRYRNFAGARGDLARKMRWGTDEPLPGWRIHYVASLEHYAFSLTDVRDACRLTYSANDTGEIIEGRVFNRRRIGIVPLDSSQ
jgi:hypothetical protein